MPNEKVSQMTALAASEMASDDLFMVGDVSAHESKKMTADQLLLFFEVSGSFVATSAANADTASYVLGSNVVGNIDSSSFSLASITSSYSHRSAQAQNAVIADSASYVNLGLTSVDTASFLRYQGFPNGTASFSLIAGSSLTAVNASNLVYTGGNNGTASYAMSGSFSITASYARSASVATTSSFSTRSTTSSYSILAETANNATTAVYALSSGTGDITKAWSMVTWSIGGIASQPELYMEYNISEIRYLTTWNYSTTWTWYNYGIIFTNPLPSDTYILIGQANSPYRHPEPAQVIFHPVYSHRTTASCTMSLAIDLGVSTAASWFAGVSGSFPNSDHSYITFTVMGQ